jgi:hypothetical protein
MEETKSNILNEIFCHINRIDHNELHQHGFVLEVFYFMCTDDTNVNKALQLIFTKRFRKVRAQQPFFAYW